MKTGYQTRQKEQIRRYMHEHDYEFLSVDEVFLYLKSEGSTIGRTTVYRALEDEVLKGKMAKITGGKGIAARYRSRRNDTHNQGQLYCIECKSVEPLDCSMLQSFSAHIEDTHRFSVNQSRTVLYGVCANCKDKHSSAPTLKEEHHE